MHTLLQILQSLKPLVVTSTFKEVRACSDVLLTVLRQFVDRFLIVTLGTPS